MPKFIKLFKYLDEYVFVNATEVTSAIQEYFVEEEDHDVDFSLNELLDFSNIADEYIKSRKLKFEPDLVITLDSKLRCIHLADLNNEFNEDQVKRMEKQYNAAFLNACDCLYYGYGQAAWNACMLDDEAKARVRAAAREYMSRD